MADSAVGVVDESDALGKEMAKVDLSAVMVVRVLEGAEVLGVILVVLVVLLSRPLWKESPQRPQFGGMHSPQGILLRNTCESIKDSPGLNGPLDSIAGAASTEPATTRRDKRRDMSKTPLYIVHYLLSAHPLRSNWAQILNPGRRQWVA